MTPQRQPDNWRDETSRLAWELDRARSRIEDLGSALESGDRASADHTLRLANDAVTSVARAVKTLGAEFAPEADSDEPDAIGSSLAIGGSGAAAIALDVLMNAMMALALTDDTSDADFLIGACVDAENIYEVSAAVVGAAPQGDGNALFDLRRAFETEGGIALRRKLTTARPRVRQIYERVRRAA